MSKRRIRKSSIFLNEIIEFLERKKTLFISRDDSELCRLAYKVFYYKDIHTIAKLTSDYSNGFITCDIYCEFSKHTFSSHPRIVSELKMKLKRKYKLDCGKLTIPVACFKASTDCFNFTPQEFAKEVYLAVKAYGRWSRESAEVLMPEINAKIEKFVNSLK